MIDATAPYNLPLAFGITNWAALGWLAAVAIPFVIHLLNRRRWQEAPWAAMQFLLAAFRTSRRRIYFEQWLLLLLRAAIIALVALAVAEPYLERSGLGAGPGPAVHHLIVLDGSYSMAYRPTDRDLFQQAKQIAAQIVTSANEGDGFTLVLMSNPAQVVVGTPVFQPRDFLAQLQPVVLPHTGTDLIGSLEQVEQLLKRTAGEYRRFSGQVVYFISDLQRAAWAPDLPLAALADLRARVARIGRLASVRIIDVGQTGAENRAVVGLRGDESFAVVGRPFHLSAQIANWGIRTYTQLPVTLVVDGHQVAEQVVHLGPGQEATVAFSYTFEAPGDHWIEVQTPPDLLPLDDRRQMAVPVKAHLAALCVDGRPAGDRLGGACGYLAIALQPQEADVSTPIVQADVIGESAFLETDLARYDCVFLCDVAQLTPEEIRALVAYLQQGGSVVFFLGPQVIAQRYNRDLCGALVDGRPLLPARLEELVLDKSQFRLDPLEYRHPIVAAFRDHEKAGLVTAPVETYYRLKLLENSTAQTVLALGDGTPLVLEQAVGRGRVVLVGTSPDTAWTALPKWPGFLPLVQEMLAYCVARQLEHRNVLVGQRFGAVLPVSLPELAVTVGLPDGRTEQAEVKLTEAGCRWSYWPRLISGVYQVKIPPPLSSTRFYAVNLDPLESNLVRTSAAELRNRFWRGVDLVVENVWSKHGEPPDIGADGGNVLSSMLLYVALALLFAETLLARQMGHYGQ